MDQVTDTIKNLVPVLKKDIQLRQGVRFKED